MTLDEMIANGDPEQLRVALVKSFTQLESFFKTCRLHLENGADPRAVFAEYLNQARTFFQSSPAGPLTIHAITQRPTAPAAPPIEEPQAPRRRVHKRRAPAPGAVQ